MKRFYKYHGAGNDFIIFYDYESNSLVFKEDQIKALCHRRFGIGADGVMILRNHSDYDFEVLYFNADGSGGTLCGNGGRCMVAFAKALHIIEEKTEFLASDGVHEAFILENGLISLKMNDVKKIERIEDNYLCYTGSPHYIQYVENTGSFDVYNTGKTIRYADQFKPEGVNVNFIEEKDTYTLQIRTYERGVEDETWACGTGSVAAALVHAEKHQLHSAEIFLEALGGELKVSFDKLNDTYTNIWLTGPADFVFEGTVGRDGIGIK